MVGPEDAYRSSPGQLAAILRLPESFEGLFSVDELSAVLRHQLRANVWDDLRASGEDRDAVGDMQAATQGIERWVHLWTTAEPPLPLLVKAKQFAKQSADHPERPLPPQIADCFYYAAVSVSLVRLGTFITTLSVNELERGLRMLLSWPWLTVELRSLFEMALDHVSPMRSEPQQARKQV